MTTPINSALPADEPVARFLTSIAYARNVISTCLRRAVDANKAQAPYFMHDVLALTAYVVEAAASVEAYRKRHAEVRDFLAKLPPDAEQDLGIVVAVPKRVGRPALKHLRNNTFHFPQPNKRYTPDSDEYLEAGLRALGDMALTIYVEPQTRVHYFTFADTVVGAIAMDKHEASDMNKLAEQLESSRAGAVALIQLADTAIDYHQKRYGYRFDEVRAYLGLGERDGNP
jgi:hypothetical protein